MQTQKIILETNFTDPYDNDPRLKFLLVDELHNGIHFSFISKWQDSTGVEGGTETYFDFEKALKKFIQRVAKERKQGCNHKNLKIIAPNLTNDFSSQKSGIETNSKQSIDGLIGINERVDRLEQQLKDSQLSRIPYIESDPKKFIDCFNFAPSSKITKEHLEVGDFSEFANSEDVHPNM